MYVSQRTEMAISLLFLIERGTKQEWQATYLEQQQQGYGTALRTIHDPATAKAPPSQVQAGLFHRAKAPWGLLHTR